MVKVVLYWSNICVLNKGEVELLKKVQSGLLLDGIDFEIKFFGLGYPTHMSDYLREDNAILPDIILTTDLEVFEDRRVFEKLKPTLIDCSKWYSNTLKGAERSYLLPYLAIPVLLFSKDKKNLSFKELKHNRPAFGGINNSAAKSVVKLMWERYGKDEAEALMESATITPMPIGAFQSTRNGMSDVALIPSLFALSDSSFVSSPLKEGIPGIPSYFAVRNTISEDIAKKLIERLNKDDFISFYEEKGKLLMASREKPSWFKSMNSDLLFLSESFISHLDPEEFYDTYCHYIPSALSYK